MADPLRVLFDATRLVTRSGLRPTGIDRVDLAYLDALQAAPGIELHLVRFGLLGPALLSARAREEVGAHWRETPDEEARFEALRRWLEAPAGEPAPARERTPPDFHAHRLWRLARGAFEWPGQALALPALLARPGPCLYLNTSHGQIYRDGVARWLDAHKLRSVFFVHDLIPMTHPEYNRAAEPARHARRLHTIAMHASRIFVNSNATRLSLERHLERLGLPAPPVDVLPLGIAPLPPPESAGAEPVSAQVPYFVILSTIEPRKNHLLLLQVWQQLVESMGDAAPRLVLIGRRGWENQAVFKLLDRPGALAHSVAEVAGLSDKALVRLLAGARALLSPSHAEGYSLPVAEALAVGTPVIASDILAHREVAAGRAELLDPLDSASWQRAIVEHAAAVSPRNAAQRKLAAGYAAPEWGTHFSRAFQALRAAAAGATLAALAACGSYLPSAGPSRSHIEGEVQSQGRPFVLVDLSAAALDTLKQRPAPSFARAFGQDETPPQLLIGPGDGLLIMIWEAGAQPLFAGGVPGSARGTTLPEQIVDRDGAISIPFAGRIPVAGQTLVQVQAAVEKALAGKTARPQVVATLSRNVTSAVTVVGEGAAGGRVPLSQRGDRLLDLVASNGRAASYETRVTLQRGAVRASLPLSAVLANPDENVYLHPGDTLVVTREPETFTAFGATGRNAQIPFDTARVNLVEAVAKAGGLQDQRADPQGVFLMRDEPGELAAKLGGEGTPAGAQVPVVYRLDLTRAGGYFLAREFTLMDGDVLYVSSAPANELTKFLQLLGLATQPAANGAIIKNSLRN